LLETRDLEHPQAAHVHRLGGQFAHRQALTIRWSTQTGVWGLDHGGWRFVRQGAARTIGYQRLETTPTLDFSLVAERVVIPLAILFEHRTSLALHASALAWQGQGVGFFGSSGAGKSTSVCELLNHGGALLADDMSVLKRSDGGWAFLPGAATLRLWAAPSSLQPVRTLALPQPQGVKHWYQLPDRCAAPQSVPVRALILLTPRNEGSVSPQFTRLRGREAASLLLAQTFDLSHPPHVWQERRFAMACALAAEVPVWRYAFRRSTDGSPTHLPTLLEWFDAN